MKKAIFLDRDGVINEPIFRDGNINKPIAPWEIDEFKLFDNIINPLNIIKKMGYHIFIVTNQPDISKGILKISTIKKMNNIIMSKLPIDEIMFCPHLDSHRCVCRKPKPGMVNILAKKWEISLSDSFFIGDNWKDIECGKGAGCTTILLDKYYNKKVNADYRVKNLSMVNKLIKSNIKQ